MHYHISRIFEESNIWQFAQNYAIGGILNWQILALYREIHAVV